VDIVAVEHRTQRTFTRSNRTAAVRHVTDYPRKITFGRPRLTDLVAIATRNSIKTYALSTTCLPTLERSGTGASRIRWPSVDTFSSSRVLIDTQYTIGIVDGNHCAVR
jgi:hypothetical protein